MKDNKKDKDIIKKIHNTPKLKRRHLFIFEKEISESNIYCQIDELNKEKINAMDLQKKKTENVIVIDDDNNSNNDIRFNTPEKKKETKRKSEVIDLDEYTPSNIGYTSTPVIYIDSDDDLNNNTNNKNEKLVKRNLFEEYFSKEIIEDDLRSNKIKTKIKGNKSFNAHFNTFSNNNGLRNSKTPEKNNRTPEKNKTIQNSIECYFIKKNDNIPVNSNKIKKPFESTNLNNITKEKKNKTNNKSNEEQPLQNNLIVNYFTKDSLKDNSIDSYTNIKKNISQIELKLQQALKKIGIDMNSNDETIEDEIDNKMSMKVIKDNEIIIKDGDLDNKISNKDVNNSKMMIEENLEENCLFNRNEDNCTIVKNSLEGTFSEIESDNSSDELDLLSMDKTVNNLFGIENEKIDLIEENNKEDEENKRNPMDNKIIDDSSKYKKLRNTNKGVEKRKAETSINNENSNKKLKPIFNLKDEIKHKDDIDKFINFDFDKFEKEYESNIENPDKSREIQNNEQSSSNLFSNIYDDDIPLTKKETKELKEFMNIEQKKFSMIIINIFPDFRNQFNDWYNELTVKNSDSSNTKYLRNNKEKKNKNLYEMCLTDISMCKLIISQKLFYIYFKDKIKTFKDNYLELLLKIVCFERNIAYSRSAMISIKELFLRKEIYNKIYGDYDNAVEAITDQKLIKLLYSPVDFFKRILSYYGFRVKEYDQQINKIKNSIDNLESDNKKIYEEIDNYADSIKEFALCNTIQYNVLDNEEFQDQIKKNINNEYSFLPIKNIRIVIELIELLSIFCINNKIEFYPSEIIFLISILYMDNNVKNIKDVLQYTIKHIVQSLDVKTWEKESSNLAKLFLYFYNQSIIYQHHILTIFTFSDCHPRITKFKSSIAKLFIKPSLFNDLFDNNKLYPISKFVEDTLLYDEKIYNLNDSTDFQEIYYRISIYFHCFGFIDEVSKSENKELIQKTTKKLWVLHNRIPDMLATHIDRTFSKNFILQLVQYLNSLFIQEKVTI